VGVTHAHPTSRAWGWAVPGAHTGRGLGRAPTLGVGCAGRLSLGVPELRAQRQKQLTDEMKHKEPSARGLHTQYGTLSTTVYTRMSLTHSTGHIATTSQRLQFPYWLDERSQLTSVVLLTSVATHTRFSSHTYSLQVST